VIYSNTREEAAAVEFDDDFIYNEINSKMHDRKIPFLHVPHPKALLVFQQWKDWAEKRKY